MTTIRDFGAKIGGAAKDRAAPRGPRARKPAGDSAPPVETAARAPSRDQYTLYTDRRTGIAFATRSGDRARRRLMEWATAREALDFMRDPGAAVTLAARWDEIRERSNVTEDKLRGTENAPRRGADHRAGGDVTPEAFMAAFRPYGVEFGNWQDDRQGALNAAYDALMDLSGAVGLPPSAIMLGGRIGLAFGARGHGKASAHYEPDRKAINLTKTRGAGCLAHEWFHAWDNYHSGPYGFTGTPALDLLWSTLRRLPLYRRSVAADETRSKKYYSTSPEVCARAFEAWVRSRVENDYLANIVPVESFGPGRDRYPYPIPEEMPTVAEAFAKLFAV